MEKDLLEHIPERPVYTIRMIVICTFIGGLPAGGYMIYQNFKTFGDMGKARATIILIIAGMLLLFGTAFVPALENVPGLVFTILLTLAVSLLTQKFQSDLIFKHIQSDGKIYSSGRAILICVISILILAAFALGAFYMQDAGIYGF